MRPFDIAELQPRAWSLLARAHQSKRVASTYLFSGPEGLGHWALGLSFAALLNCESSDNQLVPTEYPQPCWECRSCRLIAALNSSVLHLVVPIPSHKDLKEGIDFTNEALEVKRKEPFALITSSSQLTVPIDMAREIKKKLSLKEDTTRTRVVMFYQMDKMLAASADALLKMIEEPPADTVIILTADKPETLLPTIRSRSQVIRLERIADAAAVSYLITRYKLSEVQASLYARVTDGNLGRAIELAVNEDTEELTRRATGFMLFKALFLETSPEAVSLAMELVRDGGRGELEDLVRFWGSLIRDCAHFAATGDQNQIVNSDYAADIMKLSGPFADPSLAPAMTLALKNALADLRLNVHIQPSVAALSLRLGAAIRAAR